MKFGSVCSGIEAASVAWHGLGWRAAWFSEVEPFPCAVLAHHYPDVPNLGDMTTITKRVLTGEVEAPDVFCGGTPCQAFSVAGLRESLADERGNLSLKFVEIADAVDHVRVRAGRAPSIIFWENVPGVLSTKDNAFGCFLAGLAGEDVPLSAPGGKWSNSGCVYGPARAVAWRTLDAQYFGLAQRRRRVFVVASARTDFDPAAVLFEWDSMRRDIAPSRGARQDASPGTPESIGSRGQVVPEVVKCLTTGVGQRYDPETETILPVLSIHGTQDPDTLHDMAHTLGRNQGQENAVFGIPGNWIGRKPENGGNAVEPMHNIAPCLTGADRHAVQAASQVRRLTPVECERLQGFPDGYTAIPWRGKSAQDCPDGPRYKALGNSWPVTVVTWIGKRINKALEA